MKPIFRPLLHTLFSGLIGLSALSASAETLALDATAPVVTRPQFAFAEPAWPPLINHAARVLPVLAHNGMVVSQEAQASRVGLDILRKGGNAVDAAVAVGFMLAVTLPRAGNLGGGGFMLVY